jgi:hypothetical protein
MTNGKNSRRTIFLLVGLSLFGYFVSVKFTNQEIRVLKAEENLITEQIKEESLLPLEEKQKTENFFFEADDYYNFVNIVSPEMVIYEKDILGETSETCRDPEYRYDTDRICEIDPGQWEFDIEDWNERLEAGNMVTRDSYIELTEIEVPPLISGTRQMDTSVRQIESKLSAYDNVDHWTLRPDGEQINKEVVQGNSYPGDTQTESIILHGEAAKTRPFSIEYSASVSGGAEGSGTNEFTIHEYQKNTCGEDCRNDHNPTPEKSLNTSYVQTRSENYPSYYEDVQEEEESSGGSWIEGCQENTQFIDMDITGSKPVACTSFIGKIAITIKKWIADIFEAERCSTYEYTIPTEDGTEEVVTDEKCVNTATLVVIMESPWGVEKKCEVGEEEPCIIEHNELRNGGYATPGDNVKENFYLLTDCKAFVAGVIGEVDLKCAWDVNHIAEELEFQSDDNIAGEIYPEKIDYVKFQAKEAARRTDPVYEM